MNFDLNEDQRLLRDLVERFVADHYDPIRRLSYIAEPWGFSRQGWRILAETGLLALPFSEEHGGLGGGAVELITVAEALGRGVATEPVLPVILTAASLVDRGASDATKAQLLPRIIAGESLPALAHLEPGARFLATKPQTRVLRRDGQIRIDGAKSCVMGGGYADILLVTAREENGTPGVYLVDASADGMTRTDYRLVDGSVASDILFRDVPAILLPQGQAALEGVLDQARLAIVAELIGLMGHMFDATVDYVKTRQQFGQPIGRFQAVQHRLADGYAMVELSRSQLYRAAAQNPGTAEAHAAVVGAKAYISGCAMKIAEEAVQLHGGIGTTEELMVGQAFKRTMLLAALLGDADWDLRHYVQLTAAA
ncbi:acyl-CoA dehydrogenase [Sphingobium sp. Sx8-8]|uniref:acyl-CoA dehydrogenase family protein n=1 Tax=Sphingobium sp. Sx8-8 TaxID=2933617 RepID=UPI001F5A1E41